MRIKIKEKNYTASQKLTEIIAKKLGKLDKYFGEEATAYVNLTRVNQTCIMEVTIPFNGSTLRAERKADEMYSAVDLVVAVLEGQIRKHRTKLEKRLRTDAFADIELADVTVPQYSVAKTKRFPIMPMTAEEAIVQLELSEHDFYMFINPENDNVNVVYRRKDGQYGLLVPEM